MKLWQTRVLILVTMASQVLSGLWGSLPVFFTHCHEDDFDHHAEPGCDPSSCLAIVGHAHQHEHDEHVADCGTDHRCHCHHFHLRGEPQRFERGRPSEVVRKECHAPQVPPPSAQRDLLEASRALARLPDPTAAAPPLQRLLAIQSVRLLV